MTHASYSLILRDISQLDVSDLQSRLSEEGMRVVEPSGEGVHNELATIAIILLTAQALTALTLWMLRTRSGETIERNVTVRKPDGTEVTVRLKLTRESSQAPEAQIVKQIAEALKLPERAILSA